MNTGRSATRKPCRCVEDVNKLLASQGHELVLSYRLKPNGDDNGTKPVIETMRSLGAPKRSKRVTLMPTFCPFCGRKY